MPSGNVEGERKHAEGWNSVWYLTSTQARLVMMAPSWHVWVGFCCLWLGWRCQAADWDSLFPYPAPGLPVSFGILVLAKLAVTVLGLEQSVLTCLDPKDSSCLCKLV